jgi:hypothetical protein
MWSFVTPNLVIRQRLAEQAQTVESLAGGRYVDLPHGSRQLNWITREFARAAHAPLAAEHVVVVDQ